MSPASDSSGMTVPEGAVEIEGRKVQIELVPAHRKERSPDPWIRQKT